MTAKSYIVYLCDNIGWSAVRQSSLSNSRTTIQYRNTIGSVRVVFSMDKKILLPTDGKRCSIVSPTATRFNTMISVPHGTALK
jgi:hypothetical protein